MKNQGNENDGSYLIIKRPIVTANKEDVCVPQCNVDIEEKFQNIGN